MHLKAGFTMADSFRNRTKAFSIRLWLALLVTGCILPLSGIMAVLIFNFYQHEQSRLISNAIQQARSISSLADQNIASTETSLQVLATLTSLANADFKTFYRRAVLTLRAMHSDSMELADNSGHFVLSTSRPLYGQLPNLANASLLKRIFDTGNPAVSDLYISPLADNFIFTVAVPVYRNGIIEWILSATSSPVQLTDLLKKQTFPDSWGITLVDSGNLIVASTHDTQQFLGNKLSPEIVLQTS